MDISIYFEPVTESLFDETPVTTHPRLGQTLIINRAGNDFPDLTGVQIAIIGVVDDRSAVNNQGCASGADEVRHYLYKLYPGAWSGIMVDLGNIRQGHTINDTYFALAATLESLIANKVFPIVIGGGQDMTFAMYSAYAHLQKIINMVVVDPMFDLGESSDELNSQTYLSRIIMQQPNYLFNFTNLGYQTYYVDQQALDLMKKLLFDTYRLGTLHGNLPDTEPLVRNADLLSFDIGAIRAADAPGNANATPNGFSGDEACRIVRYAAMSDKLSAIGFFELNPLFDRNGLTAHLVAEMVWYVLEGFNNRKNDFPVADSDTFIRYIVPTKNFDDGIVFIKSRKTDRWWMEVVCGPENREKYASHYIVPCTYNDYQTACDNEIPDRWWQMYQKLM
ncbi:MAG: formimidoylglutamase [Lentimicrobium sp.]|nr:formimidoylglutamase [Lentimicrobium sp.]